LKWRTVALGEVADVKIGPFGSLLHKHDYLEGGVPLVNPMHIEAGSIVPDRRHAITPEKASQLANYRMVQGDVVLARRGEMGRCAVVGGAEHGFLCGTGSLIVRPGPLLSPNFLSLLLSSPNMVRTMERASLGLTMPNLNRTIVANIEFALPPLDEQRRIAAILNHADELRAKRRQMLSAVKELTRSTFKIMFCRPRGEEWPKRELSGLVDNQDARRVPLKLDDRARRRGEYAYYGASGIIDSIDDYLYEGDRLLVSEDGANLLARSSPIAFIASGRFWVNNHAHVLASSGAMELGYLEAVFAELDVSPYLTGSTQPKLTRSSLDSIAVPLPPVELQKQFVERTEIIALLGARQRRQLANQDQLFEALESRAFAGDL
jgi:type I restriction enzyme, S subunit